MRFNWRLVLALSLSFAAWMALGLICAALPGAVAFAVMVLH